jgi:uncharacterized damage-inducible protein DinB
MPYLEEPAKTLSDPHELLLDYVEAYRNAARRKVAELPESELYARRLPSGWTPLELLKHLTYMERRWFEWGFAGVAVPDPLGDEDPATGRWQVGPDETLADILAMLDAVGERTRSIVAGASLAKAAATTGRFAERQPPTLGWIFCHVLQEYARHLGHLDVVIELAGGSTGE